MTFDLYVAGTAILWILSFAEPGPVRLGVGSEDKLLATFVADKDTTVNSF